MLSQYRRCVSDQSEGKAMYNLSVRITSYLSTLLYHLTYSQLSRTSFPIENLTFHSFWICLRGVDSTSLPKCISIINSCMHTPRSILLAKRETTDPIRLSLVLHLLYTLATLFFSSNQTQPQRKRYKATSPSAALHPGTSAASKGSHMYSYSATSLDHSPHP